MINLKDKRGIAFTAAFAFFIVIILVALVFLASFVFSGTLRFILIGIALFVGVIFLLGKSFQSGQGIPRSNLAIILILVVVGLFFVLGGGGILQTQFGGANYVEIPVFASVECKLSGSDKSATIGIPEEGRWISDFLPKNTNAWNIILDGSSGFTQKRFEYYICPSRTFCSNRNFETLFSSGGNVNIGSVPSTSHVWVQYQTKTLTGYKGFEPSTAEISYTPFSLIRDDPFRGGRQEISNTCVIPTSDSSWRKRIVSSESSGVSTWGGSNSLNPGDFYNYVTTNIVSVTEGNTQDGGWCIYENNQAKVFAIEETRTGDGTRYDRVNIDKIISRPQCCNGAAVPGGVCEDGNFVPVTEVQCNTRADCGIIEWIPGSDPNTVQRPLCQNNQCTFETRNVDCTIDSQCSTNSFCSRNSYTCEIASDTDLGPGEEREISSRIECDQKAEESPLLGYQWVETSTSSCGFNPLCLTGITDPKVTTTAECKATFLPFYVFGGLGFLFLIIISFLLFGGRKKKKRKGGRK